MPDQPSHSKQPSARASSDAGGQGEAAGSASPSSQAVAGSGQQTQRNLSAVAADLAIQQENEGLRLALREQERIVEELTNECRRLEDRLEDRYQDIDALRRELDRGERALKQAEERSSQLLGDNILSAASQPEAQAEPGGKDSKNSRLKSARIESRDGVENTRGKAGRGGFGFATGLLSGVAVSISAVAAMWFTGLLTLAEQRATLPETATPTTTPTTTPVAPTQPPAVASRQTPTADTVASVAEVAISKPSSNPSPGPGPSQGLEQNAPPEQTGDLAGQEPSNVPPGNESAQDAPGLAAQASDEPAGEPAGEPAREPVQAPVKPVAGTHRDSFLAGETQAPEMVVMNASEFMMGNPVGMADSDARPVFKVSLDGFMISAHEVTFADYDRFVRETGARRPQDYGWGRGSRPVIDVSWEDAQAYAEWLSAKTGKPYRLPTEAEWEYAARGGTTSSYWWGIGSPASRALCIDCGTRWDRISTAPVGSFPPNPFGLFDTAGNVYEWVADCYHQSYRGAASDGSAREMPDCKQRVVRGGSFNSPASTMRSHARNRFSPDARTDMLGFRIARDREPLRAADQG